MPRGPRSKWRYPYYKVQQYDDRSLAWIDKHRAFESIQEARVFIRDRLASDRTRILVIEADGQHPLQDDAP